MTREDLKTLSALLFDNVAGTTSSLTDVVQMTDDAVILRQPTYTLALRLETFGGLAASPTLKASLHGSIPDRDFYGIAEADLKLEGAIQRAFANGRHYDEEEQVELHAAALKSGRGPIYEYAAD